MADNQPKITYIRDFDYAIIRCGYTHRLIEYIDDIKDFIKDESRWICDHKDKEGCEKCFNEKLVYIDESNILESFHTNKYNIRVCGLEEDMKKIRSMILEKDLFGTIGFKTNKLNEVFALVEHLITYDHCACFNIKPYEMTFIEKNGIKIVMLWFDTESG